MNDYDGLNLCAECGDAYTHGTLCHNCARQHAIDNDPMYGYDDDGDDDEPLYRSYADDFAFPDTYYDDGDGYGPYEYDDDDTIDLAPSWRWKWFKLKTRLKYIWQWKLSHPIHNLRMKYDKRYYNDYWNSHIPF